MLGTDAVDALDVLSVLVWVERRLQQRHLAGYLQAVDTRPGGVLLREEHAHVVLVTEALDRFLPCLLRRTPIEADDAVRAQDVADELHRVAVGREHDDLRRSDERRVGREEQSRAPWVD